MARKTQTLKKAPTAPVAGAADVRQTEADKNGANLTSTKK